MYVCGTNIKFLLSYLTYNRFLFISSFFSLGCCFVFLSLTPLIRVCRFVARMYTCNKEAVKKKYNLHMLRDIENYVADKVRKHTHARTHARTHATQQQS